MTPTKEKRKERIGYDLWPMITYSTKNNKHQKLNIYRPQHLRAKPQGPQRETIASPRKSKYIS